MRSFKLASCAIGSSLLIGLSAGAMAADPSYDSTRQQRMDDALQNYRSSQGSGNTDRSMRRSDSSAGPAERAENSMKRGLHRTGEAIKHGAQKTGEVVGRGVNKTGQAIHHGGEKLENASASKP